MDRFHTLTLHGRHHGGGHGPRYPGGGLTGRTLAPFDAMHCGHDVCAFSSVASPPLARGIA
jgi:hypothetical protein